MDTSLPPPSAPPTVNPTGTEPVSAFVTPQPQRIPIGTSPFPEFAYALAPSLPFPTVGASLLALPSRLCSAVLSAVPFHSSPPHQEASSSSSSASSSLAPASSQPPDIPDPPTPVQHDPAEGPTPLVTQGLSWTPIDVDAEPEVFENTEEAELSSEAVSVYSDDAEPDEPPPLELDALQTKTRSILDDVERASKGTPALMKDESQLDTLSVWRSRPPNWTLTNPAKAMWVDMEYFYLTSPFTSRLTGRVYTGDTLAYLKRMCEDQQLIHRMSWNDFRNFIFEVGKGAAKRNTIHYPREISWAFMSTEKGRAPYLLWDCMEVRYPLPYDALKHHRRSGCNAWDYHQVHYLRKHVHGLPFYPTDPTNQVTLLDAACLPLRALLHTKAQHICIKGSASEAILLERLLKKASTVMQVLIPPYEFHITANPFLIAPHWRVKHGRSSDLQPFIDMVATALPQHSHSGLPSHPQEPRPDHCSAVEVLYYSTHYQYRVYPDNTLYFCEHKGYPPAFKYQRPPPKSQRDKRRK